MTRQPSCPTGVSPMFCPFSRLSISARLVLLLVLVTLGNGGLFGVGYLHMRRTAIAQHEEQTKSLVQTAYALASLYVRDEREGKRTHEEAQVRALRVLSALHYGENGYFWVNDKDGVFLAHPLERMKGKNVLEDKDSDGRFYMKNFLKIAQEKGEGFTTYNWPPEKKDRKLSYIKSVPEWGWVIGSGVYFDSIEAEVKPLFARLFTVSLLIFVSSLFLVTLIGCSVSRDLKALNGVMERLIRGDVGADTNLGSRQDEIGSIAKTIHAFAEKARAEDKEAASPGKEELISIVSHEIRTPLTSISASIDLILGTMRNFLPNKAEHLLLVAQSNARRLMLLANDLLEIEKVAAGEVRLNMREEALAPLLAGAIEMNRSYADKYGVVLEKSEIPEKTRVRVDEARLLQIVSNLLSNAVKFSPPGEKVVLSAREEEGWARILVTDRGPGIPEAFRDKLFRRFSQADEKREGAGLGLHISKTLVELMGGQIGFETETGVGTTFWVTFPVIG